MMFLWVFEKQHYSILSPCDNRRKEIPGFGFQRSIGVKVSALAL
jgi:hypothetical protein